MKRWPLHRTSPSDQFSPIDEGPLADRAAAPRVRMAASSDASPSTLRELASDPDIIVRAAVAINSACGPEITRILASDRDERIRALLGARIARLLPELDGDGHDDAAEHILATLAALARDQAIRVRAAIADEIKSMQMAPRDLVLLLAQDEAVEVSEPVIRLSPVLTDADLLALLATPPNAVAAQSIASRPKLSPTVADAIAVYADAPAIQALLSNQSACIQEATLDALVGRAPEYPGWHDPLVRRPHLSVKAVKAFSEFIAADLLRILEARTDLDPAKIEIVRSRLTRETAGVDERAVIVEALRFKANHTLTETLILDAAQAGDTVRVAVLLAVAGGVSVQTVHRVVELRSAKAIVSLTWFCGFSMRTAIAVQVVLAQLGPDSVLSPSANGEFPLSKEEMDWQMELLNNPTPEAALAGPSWSGRSLRQPA